MAQRLLLVNPTRKRKTRRKAATKKAVAKRKTATRRSKPVRRNPVAKRRTAAQKAATRKMIAANRRRAGGKRRAPAKRRRVRRNPATKARQRKTYSRVARMNPRRRRRSVRRNPMSVKNIINEMLKPAAVGAVGAIANDALFMYLPLPAQFKMPGVARYASKGLTAVAMTWIASKVVKRQTAVQLGIGALTCLTAEVARKVMADNFPVLAPTAVEGMGLYTMGYYNPATPAGGGMGVYVPGNENYQLPSLAAKETAGVAPSGGVSGMGVYTDANGYSYA